MKCILFVPQKGCDKAFWIKITKILRFSLKSDAANTKTQLKIVCVPTCSILNGTVSALIHADIWRAKVYGLLTLRCHSAVKGISCYQHTLPGTTAMSFQNVHCFHRVYETTLAI
jgi:hypothetical protein